MANYARFVETPRFRTAFVNTLIVGFGGLVGSLVLGSAMAFCMARIEIRGSRIVSLLAILALVSPPFIGAYSWIVLFGSGGLVRQTLMSWGIFIPPIFGLWGILIVFSFKFYPYVYLLASGALANINRSLEEAAESLGLTPFRRVIKISFPLVLPAISAGGLLALIHSIADFGTPRLIGRGFNVLATEAYTLYSAEIGSNLSMATTISIVLIMLSMLFVFAQRYMSRRNVYHGNLINKPVKKKLTGFQERRRPRGRLHHRVDRGDAGNHRGDLLGPAHERSGVPSGLRPRELPPHPLQSCGRGAELADVLVRDRRAHRDDRNAHRMPRGAGR